MIGLPKTHSRQTGYTAQQWLMLQERFENGCFFVLFITGRNPNSSRLQPTGQNRFSVEYFFKIIPGKIVTELGHNMRPHLGLNKIS